MSSILLILHALVGAALLGALTHQVIAALGKARRPSGSFVARYAGVNAGAFSKAIVVLYVVQFTLGALIYPAYRLEVRIPFEEMSLGWAIGVFELKEHFAGIGLMALPLYLASWRPHSPLVDPRDRIGMSLLLAGIVWWDFLIGHILNNIRGLG